MQAPCLLESMELGIRLDVQDGTVTNPGEEVESALFSSKRSTGVQKHEFINRGGHVGSAVFRSNPQAMVCEGLYLVVTQRLTFTPHGTTFNKALLLDFILQDDDILVRSLVCPCAVNLDHP